jgi:uncharacterized protein (DUF305 family)
MRPLAVAIAGTLVAVALTACTGSEDVGRSTSTAPVVQLGAPGHPNRTLSADEQLSPIPLRHNDADIAFARDMIRHHNQALVMTGYVDDRTTTSDIRLLAKRMRDGQADEINLLKQWLSDRGEPPNDLEKEHGGHDLGESMPGMLSEAELAQLEAARSAEFDRLFLELMTKHHEGALLMVAELNAQGGGQEPALGQIAQHIDSDQRIELARMASLLAP